jgi:hypothetical protein
MSPPHDCLDAESNQAPTTSDSSGLPKIAKSPCEPAPWKPWNLKPPTRYSFTFTRQCFCLPESLGPFVVFVENGIVTSALYGSVETDYVTAPGSLQSYSLDSLWSEVNASLSHPYAHAFVRYASTWGFPDSVFIDRVLIMADDESGFTIKNFRIIDY